MTTAIMKGEEAMTDYQFKSIIKMVLAIARKTNEDETPLLHTGN
jgi:hypothetical protein